MNPKKIWTLFLLCLCTVLVSAQNTNHLFDLGSPARKAQMSLYNTFVFLDSRPDPSFMGVVQLGGFNRKAPVQAARPMDEQFLSFLNELIDSTAKDGEALFQLRQLSFAEITGAMSEKGYCYLRGTLYGKEGDLYRKILGVDTVMVISGMDVTKSLFRQANTLLYIVMHVGLKRAPRDSTGYTYDQLVRISDIEKAALPVYTLPAFKDGIYLTYDAFKQQQPDELGMITGEDGQISGVSRLNKKGKPEKMTVKDLYAVVHQGKPYVATYYGLYPLQREGNELTFRGVVKSTAESGDVIAASLFFGLLGGLIVSDASAPTDLYIDHLSGAFIRRNSAMEEK